RRQHRHPAALVVGILGIDETYHALRAALAVLVHDLAVHRHDVGRYLTLRHDGRPLKLLVERIGRGRIVHVQHRHEALEIGVGDDDVVWAHIRLRGGAAETFSVWRLSIRPSAHTGPAIATSSKGYGESRT